MHTNTVSFLTREDPKKFPAYNHYKGILENGVYNRYPTEVEDLINNSPNASQCADIYANFLSGKGFETTPTNLSEFYWLYYDQNDLLRDVVESISRHQGAFIHVRYNANFEKSGFACLPYENCRLSKIDSQNYYAFVYHNSTAYRNRFGIDDEFITKYHSYNPNPEVIEKQVEKVGSIERYNGQVYYLKLGNKYVYTDPLISRAWECAQVDYQLNQYYLATVKNGFHDTLVIRHNQFANEEELKAFEKALNEVIGTQNASSILRIEDNFGGEDIEGNFKIEQLKKQYQAR